MLRLRAAAEELLYVAPAATAEVFLTGIPAPSAAGCGLAVGKNQLSVQTGSRSRPSSRNMMF